MRDGVPLPSTLSGEIEERLVRVDRSLFFIIAGAMEFATDLQNYTETGALTVEEVREALGEMLWIFYTEEAVTMRAGMILQYAGATPPDGWLECDGSVLVKTDYPKLFSAIGATWNTGSEPGTSFRIPDLRNRVLVGVGSRALGVYGGEETHVLITAEMPNHFHSFGIKGATGAATANRVPASSDSTVRVNSTNTDATGGDGAHNNMQPFGVVRHIIATGE